MTPLTVVTVTHESSRVLEGFLQRLEAGRGAGDVVVVVDSGSTDAAESRSVAERFGARFRNVPENVGFGTASNIGAFAAETKFVAFVNPDVETDFHALHTLVAEAELVGAACVGPRVRDEQGNFARAERGTIRAPWSRRSAARATDLNRTESIAGCCMVLPTARFNEIGGFDPFFFMFTEEIDLHRRLRQAGGEIAVVSSVTVVTEGGGSSAEVGSRWSVTEREVAHVRYVWKWFGATAASVDLAWRLGLIVRKRMYRPAKISVRQLLQGVFSHAGDRRRAAIREYGVETWE